MIAFYSLASGLVWAVFLCELWPWLGREALVAHAAARSVVVAVSSGRWPAPGDILALATAAALLVILSAAAVQILRWATRLVAARLSPATAPGGESGRGLGLA